VSQLCSATTMLCWRALCSSQDNGGCTQTCLGGCEASVNKSGLRTWEKVEGWESPIAEMGAVRGLF
jgi:hypothetical protein